MSCQYSLYRCTKNLSSCQHEKSSSSAYWLHDRTEKTDQVHRRIYLIVSWRRVAGYAVMLQPMDESDSAVVVAQLQARSTHLGNTKRLVTFSPLTIPVTFSLCRMLFHRASALFYLGVRFQGIVQSTKHTAVPASHILPLRLGQSRLCHT